MTTEDVQFYLRHRSQISEWATLETRADDLMRQTVLEGDHDKAIRLLKADSGDQAVDFYVRNRLLIAQWDALQSVAGQALHDALLAVAREAGAAGGEGKRGWTVVHAPSSQWDRLRDEQRVWVELEWTKQDLLSTRRGCPFPRLALVMHPDRWQGDNRDLVVQATRAVAHGLGMKRRATWSVHWRVLDPISESQDLQSYAEQCVGRLQEASERLYPVLLEAISATNDLPTGSG